MSRKSKQEEIRELKAQRMRYLQDYKMGLRQAKPTVDLINEVDRRLKELKRGN